MLNKVITKQNRSLLTELVRTDFKLRYQGSVLGYLWSLLKPLLMFAIMYVVFTKFLKIGSDIPHYPIYLLLGIVIWNLFGEVTSMGMTSIVARGDLIRKIKIPRWIIVFSASLSAVINLGLSLVVVGVFIIINDVPVSWHILLVPLSLLQVYVLALGLSFFLSAAYVKLRDLGNIWEIVMQAGFYITPVFYPLGMIENTTYQKILLMNPMAQAIQDIRFNAVTQETVTSWGVINNTWFTLIPIVIVVIIAMLGVYYFKGQSKSFAENL